MFIWRTIILISVFTLISMFIFISRWIWIIISLLIWVDPNLHLCAQQSHRLHASMEYLNVRDKHGDATHQRWGHWTTKTSYINSIRRPTLWSCCNLLMGFSVNVTEPLAATVHLAEVVRVHTGELLFRSILWWATWELCLGIHYQFYAC